MNHPARRARHFEGGPNAFQLVHVKTAWTVAFPVPIGATKGATAFAGCWGHPVRALIAKNDIEAPATHAARRIEHIEQRGKRPANHMPEYRRRDRARTVYNERVEITVLLFASIAQKAGVRSLKVPFEAGDDVGRVRDRVLERFPQIRSSLPTLLYALNEEYVRESDPVCDGATLALIPPVSGG